MLENIYLILVILMLGLAVFDLVVGVSNDAVNFLTSAVGAKAANFRTIIIVASIGVFIGASSSGGMLEIAKKGVFNPSFFTFYDIMMIYVVVMMCDVLLLDLFNSLKLPTSTTISIVFELLGASLCVSFMKIYTTNQPISNWFEYINTQKALEMITAIFISVAVAFLLGWLVQFLLRAIVTFDYKKHLKIPGSIFGALSVVVVLNFIIKVALKNSPLKDTVAVQFIFENTTPIYFIIFLVFFAFFYLKSRQESYDTFRTVTLIGTFALAMAFASNDLVNFIGVPVASYEAFQLWKSSQLAPEQFTMEAFSGIDGETTANPIFLIVAGIVMVIVLATSKKARNVIQTTVNLSRQSDGVERFKGNDLVRAVVRFISFTTTTFVKLFPKSFSQAIEKRMKIRTSSRSDPNEATAAFDMVRASVNLIVAAGLISLGTAYKLPLSTTYVSFMVVMGTSLADRAWNKDSAVYRVSGVFTVISGWFLTAISALTISMLFAGIAYGLGLAGIVVVLTIVSILIYLVNKYSNNELQLEVDVQLPDELFNSDHPNIGDDLLLKTQKFSNRYAQFAEDLVNAVLKEDRSFIRQVRKRLKKQEEVNFEYRATFINQLKGLDQTGLTTGKTLFKYYLLEEELINDASQAVEIAKSHILNMHSPLDTEQQSYLTEFVDLVKNNQMAINSFGHDSIERIEESRMRIKDHINKAIDFQISGISENRFTFKNSQLYLGILVKNLDASDTLFQMYLLSNDGENKWQF